MGHGEFSGEPVDIIEIPVRFILVLLLELGFVKVGIPKRMLIRSGGGLDGVGDDGRRRRLLLLLLRGLGLRGGDGGGLGGGFGMRAFTGISRGRVGKGDILVLRRSGMAGREYETRRAKKQGMKHVSTHTRPDRQTRNRPCASP